MITLGIDTTANTATVALVRDGGLLASSTVNGTLTHSETMLPMLEQMLANVGMEASEIDAFAAAEGPGSFTGVRIGVAMIKGLAFASNKPCIGVSALEALAKNLEGFTGLVVPVMDARRSQVYCAIFKDGEQILEDSLIPLAELQAKLAQYDEPIYFVGDGYSVAHKYFVDDTRVRKTPAGMIAHNATSVAFIGERMLSEAEDVGKLTDRTLAPRYLRAPQAERERNERLAAEKNG